MKIMHVPFELKQWLRGPHGEAVVYFYIKGGKLVYIGSTNSLAIRTRYTRAEVQPDSIWYFDTNTRGEAFDCELWLIEMLRPRFNKDRRAKRLPPPPYPPFFKYGVKRGKLHKAA